MKFRPLHDRVVVRRIESEEKTKGGIIIPDTAKEKPQEGEIIAVGSGARDEAGKLIPLDVKTGDRVLFGRQCYAQHIGFEEIAADRIIRVELPSAADTDAAEADTIA